jgi:hypothetical protein
VCQQKSAAPDRDEEGDQGHPAASRLSR